jgi:PDDEXK-like uncharacterized protein DUF3799
VITSPGCYEMTQEEYHKDPCETPSLSAGMINDILEAPKKCWHASRRLNPYWEEPAGAERFTIGSVTHIIHLEPHLLKEKVLVVNAADWRTKDAKTARDDAKKNGMVAILAHHMDAIHEARAAFAANKFVASAFENGKTEQSLFWLHPTLKIWCRARPDFISNTHTHLCDHKATADANPEKFGKHAYDLGYHRRAAWYIEGAEIVFGKKFAHYWFVNQETKAPYLTSVVELDESALEAGRVENERAARLFTRCLERDDWFGYRHPDQQDKDLAFKVGLPNWAYIQIDQRDGVYR